MQWSRVCCRSTVLLLEGDKMLPLSQGFFCLRLNDLFSIKNVSVSWTHRCAQEIARYNIKIEWWLYVCVYERMLLNHAKTDCTIVLKCVIQILYNSGSNHKPVLSWNYMQFPMAAVLKSCNHDTTGNRLRIMKSAVIN